MTENNKNQPRAWIYARVPDNLPETQASFNACCQQAARDGCCIAGGGMDLTCIHTMRRGYRDMLQQIKAGNVDRVYICRMREIGGNEHQLFGFFKCAMDHGVKVRTLEYSLPARLQQYELGEKIENYAAKHNRPMPWVV